MLVYQVRFRDICYHGFMKLYDIIESAENKLFRLQINRL